MGCKRDGRVKDWTFSFLFLMWVGYPHGLCLSNHQHSDVCAAPAQCTWARADEGLAAAAERKRAPVISSNSFLRALWMCLGFEDWIWTKHERPWAYYMVRLYPSIKSFTPFESAFMDLEGSEKWSCVFSHATLGTQVLEPSYLLLLSNPLYLAGSVFDMQCTWARIQSEMSLIYRWKDGILVCQLSLVCLPACIYNHALINNRDFWLGI